jgi:nitrate/TMAO reductase-like tetraheme cytochrome c subunit
MNRVLSFIALPVVGLSLVLLAPSDLAEQESTKQEAAKQDATPQTGLNHAAKVKNCRKCHLDVMAEWENSLHAKSWSNPVFQAAVKRLGKKAEECARCHAPDSVPLVGAGNLPHARPDDRDLGVNCVTCHLNGRKYFGPHRSKGHGGIVVEKAYSNALFCSSCHGHSEVNKAHDAYTSYLTSPAHKEGKSCQDCHMETVNRQMVKSKKKLRRNVQRARDCKTHIFAGAHTSGKASGAAELTAKIIDGKLTVQIRPKTGHDLPASHGREVRLTVKMLDKSGATLKKRVRSWDLSRGKALSPASNNEQVFEIYEGTVSTELILVLMLSRAPGRPEAVILPIATMKL